MKTLEETKTLKDLELEIKKLTDKVKAIEASPAPQGVSSGTIQALSDMLLNPVTPNVISFSNPHSTVQYPASFKFQFLDDAGLGQSALVVYAKSQFTTNQDWMPVFNIGTGGQVNFYNAAFFQNTNIKFYPSDSGEADIGTNVTVPGNGPLLPGLGITGKSVTTGTTRPVISLYGDTNVGNGKAFTVYDVNRTGTLILLPPNNTNGVDPILQSTTNWIVLPGIKPTNIQSSGPISGTTGTFSGNLTAPNFIGNVTVTGGNFTSGITGTTANFSGNITGATVTSTGQLNAGSITTPGNVQAASETITGTLTGNIANFSGAITAASETLTGTLQSAGLNITNPAQMQFGNNWLSHTPSLTASGGMTVSMGSVSIRYIRIGPFVIIYGFIVFTTSGTLSTTVTASLPVTCIETTTSAYQQYKPGTGDLASIFNVSAYGGLDFKCPADANYTAATYTVSFQAFYRCS